MTRRSALLLAAAAVAAALAWWRLAVHVPPGPRSARVFDPDRLAALEGEMWRAYYRKEKVRLFRMLVTALREQFRYPWVHATRAAFYLARAAATFADARAGYDRVLPDLERAFAIARHWTGAGYDPAAVARAELAWWVARRDPARRDPAVVGALLADVYAAFYEVPRQRVAEAGALRARAADLRDRGGAWPEVDALLRASYRALHAGVQR